MPKRAKYYDEKISIGNNISSKGNIERGIFIAYHIFNAKRVKYTVQFWTQSKVDRSITCYRDYASKRTDLRALIREIGVHEPYRRTASIVRLEKSCPMHIVRRPTVYYVPCLSLSLSLPLCFPAIFPRKDYFTDTQEAHLACLDNRHTGAFIMSGSERVWAFYYLLSSRPSTSFSFLLSFSPISSWN